MAMTAASQTLETGPREDQRLHAPVASHVSHAQHNESLPCQPPDPSNHPLRFASPPAFLEPCFGCSFVFTSCAVRLLLEALPRAKMRGKQLLTIELFLLLPAPAFEIAHPKLPSPQHRPGGPGKFGRAYQRRGQARHHCRGLVRAIRKSSHECIWSRRGVAGPDFGIRNIADTEPRPEQAERYGGHDPSEGA